MDDAALTALSERPAKTETALVSAWLEDFEVSLGARDGKALAALFQADSHWRDLLAFTWHLTPCLGADAIGTALAAAQGKTQASGFRVSGTRTPPRRVRRLGIDVIEGMIEFETAIGRGEGVVRLVPGDGSAMKAWVLLTTLEELKGFEEHVGARRPTGEAYSRNFGGENWLDQCIKAREYADRDPAVLVVGGGQAGLAIAARLNQLDVDTLVVDRHERIGDNWRKRYHSLALHNQIVANHLPYMPFPPTMPKYIPKDMLANWFECYAEALEVNFWTGTEFVCGSYDDVAKCWNATIRRLDGTERTMRPRHVTGSAAFPASRICRDSRTSPARSCIRIASPTAGPGRAGTLLCSGPATAGMTWRRTCTATGRIPASSSADRAPWSASIPARS
jgi:hypothetical protein